MPSSINTDTRLLGIYVASGKKDFKMEGQGLCMNGNGIIRNYASNENKYSIKVGKKGTITRQI